MALVYCIKQNCLWSMLKGELIYLREDAAFMDLCYSSRIEIVDNFRPPRDHTIHDLISYMTAVP